MAIEAIRNWHAIGQGRLRAQSVGLTPARLGIAPAQYVTTDHDDSAA
jgi:hypothetical protein